ncbi:hypothetical protein OHC33_008494 [Knufia fluminis]|uniref:Uncharacterized protein n=1 Tax=Knufia fluminis TaxID=191047 RepID=A0AAN8EN90_9EURO|nr:hypothetical protein OHC33_008494 [Knufia fluminis]
MIKPTTSAHDFAPVFKVLVEQAASGKVNFEFKDAWNPDVLYSNLAGQDLDVVSFKLIMERDKHSFALYDLASTMPQP